MLSFANIAISKIHGECMENKYVMGLSFFCTAILNSFEILPKLISLIISIRSSHTNLHGF